VETSGSTIDLAALVDPATYRDGPPHETWTRMRRDAPVLWCEIAGHEPFWALTRHADIRFVSTHPELFSSAGRIVLAPTSDPQGESFGRSFGRTVVNTDPPEHREYRGLAGPFFRPSVLKGLETRIREITRVQLDAFTAKGADHDVDFVTDVASWHPLKMICEILGLSEEHEPIVLRISNELFGSTDPEFARDQSTLMVEMYGFLSQLVAERRAKPGDDLSSVLANALLNGEPLADRDLMLYLVVLITAGHETTRNSIAGGMLAFLQNPDQLGLLRAHPPLAETAANEIVRWTTPVMQFMRTATRDCELGGQHIRAGEAVALYYPSANRDEEVFEDPFSFRVDRDPNPHLGWGVGEHYCLGAALARMEIRVLLEELVPRLERPELIGRPQWTEATFASGVKHLPMRWTINPSRISRG
jgi:cytochrome P450